MNTFKMTRFSLFLVFSTVLFLSACKDSPTSPNDLPEANFPCEDGKSAGKYDCDDVSLYAHLTAEELGGAAANDIWGWTDPQTGTEYALVGLNDGVSFVDISDPNNPVVVGKLLESTSNSPQKTVFTNPEDFPACVVGIGESEQAKAITEGSTWRDMKVYNNHMFVVSDGQVHGMQVFDLTHLRDFDGEYLEFTHDAHYDRLDNAHNIVINENSGYAYAVGVTSAEICGSRSETGLHIIDIRNPLNPTFAGCYFDPETEGDNGYSAGVGYIHDAQCVDYTGPDTEHAGKELCFSSAEGTIVISDVSDKSNPTTIGYKAHPEFRYSHQGWLTEDQKYFLMDDELDELYIGRGTQTYVWDVSDLENPTFVGYYSQGTASIDHNMYVKENKVYQTNYTSGLRVLKINDLSDADMSLMAYFDTQPSDPNQSEVSFNGTWSNYPFFESGVIIVSDIRDGLFILKPEF